MLLLLGGLSGAGKTTLGKYLEEHCGFHWVELDRPRESGDPFDELAIHTQWAAFLKGDAAPLRERYSGKTVIIVKAPMYRDSDLVRIRYLWGPKKKCFERAHKRSPEIVNQRHWDYHNKLILEYLGSGECPTEWKIAVFDESGNARNIEELAHALVR